MLRYDLHRGGVGSMTRGWHWRWEEYPNHVVELGTNCEYAGLFLRKSDGTWTQLRGNSQFHLPRDRQAAIRLLRRHDLTPVSPGA